MIEKKIKGKSIMKLDCSVDICPPQKELVHIAIDRVSLYNLNENPYWHISIDGRVVYMHLDKNNAYCEFVETIIKLFNGTLPRYK